MMIPYGLYIRSATRADDAALARLASLSHRDRPSGRTLIVETDESVVAAIGVTSGAVLADPSGDDEEAIQLLRRSRYQLLRQGASGQARSLLRRLGGVRPATRAA
jgi:hypothetical protein